MKRTTRRRRESGSAPETGGAARGLDARLVVRRAAFDLDLALTAEPGEVVALLGPNGAGKSTALRALAGLVPMAGGHIRVDGRDLRPLPAERRGIGMVFQDYLLFPHLSALENVAFGPRCQGAGRRAARHRAGVWLERVGLAEFAGARPRTLSGGQAQRVALARALAVEPGLLLLDEPLAALDAHTRLEIRSALRRHLAGFGGAAVLVTHDPLDAMVLADRIVVVEGGRLVQEGTPADVARRPRTDYVAGLVGLNLYRGRAAAGAVLIGDAPAAAGPAPGDLPRGGASGGRAGAGAAGGPGTKEAGSGPSAGERPRGGACAGGPAGAGEAGGAATTDADGGVIDTLGSLEGEVFLAFAPSAVALYRSRPDGSPRNLWRARVAAVERQGDRVRVQLSGACFDAVAEVTPAAVAELRLAEGSLIWAAVKTTETHVYPA